MPNLRYFNKIIYSLFDKELLKIHNLNAMSPNVISELAGEFDILYCDYYKSTLFDFNKDSAELSKIPAIKSLFLFISKIIRALRLDNIPNRFFSPYIVFIGKLKSSC